MLCKCLKSASLIFIAINTVILFGGCSVEASKPELIPKSHGDKPPAPKDAIQITPDSPSDTVKVFYRKLREKRIREAIFLTNLRPAIEGLTESELKEFSVDFEAVAAHIPADIEINGEIISGDSATVTARLPDESLEKTELQEIRLRKENNIWVILTVDENAEKLIKQEGKNYFYALRIETHHAEAKAMLDRISKAQIAYAAQHNGGFGEMQLLIQSGFLPPDVSTPESTGYVYEVTLTDSKTKYFATATPAVYGKSGKLSFIVFLNDSNNPVLKSKDSGGGTLKK